MRASEEFSMSRALLAAVLAVIATSAVWLALMANRTPTEDRVTGNVLARINAEYRDQL
jgi:hypothetical protein